MWVYFTLYSFLKKQITITCSCTFVSSSFFVPFQAKTSLKHRIKKEKIN